MTEPSIAEQADALAAELQAASDAIPPYSSRTPFLTPEAGISLARMVGALARRDEQQPTETEDTVDVLLNHQGPFFNGGEMRCSCRHLVANGQEWAKHVAKLIGGQHE